jgi:calcineurin-like phosphoesterase family protein
MRWFFTADTHFNHANIIDYCDRPFKSAEHMDREVIRRWNEKVKNGDIVVHLGDFGFLRGEKDQAFYSNQLNGKIILIKGNHDHNNSVNTKIESLVIQHGGVHWWCQHRPELRYTYNLCGHVHENWKVWKEHGKVCVNVGVDQWDFRPITVQDILKTINRSPHGYS